MNEFKLKLRPAKDLFIGITADQLKIERALDREKVEKIKQILCRAEHPHWLDINSAIDWMDERNEAWSWLPTFDEEKADV